MNNLLCVALHHTRNVLKSQSYRLFQKTHLTKTLKDFVAQTTSYQQAKNVTASLKRSCTSFSSIDTTLSKDVMLFKYENPKYYNMLNIFAMCQFVFWSYLSHFAFTTLKDAPVEGTETELKWYQRINLGDNKYRNGITIICFLIGYGILVAAWMFTLRSVRFLVLHKGGKKLSFVTYGPFNKNRIMTVPLNCVSAQESRNAARVQLPIKIKNRSLFYMLDMRGEFRNGPLFDKTAGLKRRI